MEQMQQRLLALVLEAPASAVARLQQLLAAGDLHPDMTASAAAAALQPERIAPQHLQPLWNRWQRIGAAALPPVAMALALGAARAMHADISRKTPRLDLVWTGPHAPPGASAQDTVAVLRQMIAGAQDRILLVGYNLTVANPYSQQVLDELARAAARHCKIRIALHDDGHNHLNLADLWPRHLGLPRLLRWSGVPGDPKASLHAKLLVVDSQDLLITSANLTFHGLEQNIEMGVRIRGDFAYQVDRHFALLEDDGILSPYPLSPR